MKILHWYRQNKARKSALTEPFTKDSSTDNTKTEAVNKKAEAEVKKAVEVIDSGYDTFQDTTYIWVPNDPFLKSELWTLEPHFSDLKFNEESKSDVVYAKFSLRKPQESIFLFCFHRFLRWNLEKGP